MGPEGVGDGGIGHGLGADQDKVKFLVTKGGVVVFRLERLSGEVQVPKEAGLMDAAIPEMELQKITEIMKPFEAQGIIFHGLLARQAASARFITVHMLFPGGWTVHHAHSLAEDFEGAVRTALPNTTITTHLESLEDTRSFSHGQDEAPPFSNSRSMS